MINWIKSLSRQKKKRPYAVVKHKGKTWNERQ